MPKIQYDVIIQSISSDNLKVLVLLFLFFNKELKAALCKALVWVYMQLIKQLPSLKNNLVYELEKLRGAMPAPSQTSQKADAWGEITIYVLFSAYIAILIGMAIISLMFHELSLLRILMTAIFVIFFGYAAWFYRASAHLIANKNGINKYPWRKQTGL